MRFVILDLLAGVLLLQCLFQTFDIHTTSAAPDVERGPEEKLADSESQVKQLQALLDVVSKHSLEISLLQSENQNQKYENKRIQDEQEVKEQQTRNQLNDLEEENRQLHEILQTLVKNRPDTDTNITLRSSLLNDNNDVNLYMTATGGVTYVRWGRTRCEGSAYPVYTGHAASGGSAGGTTDLVCLPSVPHYQSMLAGGFSFLTGVEYDFSGSPFSTTNNGGSSLYNNDMPCTVCYVSARSNQFMYPGCYNCPSGWTKEYAGYLVSTRYNNYRSAMVCLDQAPEAASGGIGRANGHFVVPVEARCTAIHCPPYKTDNELPCAVCSK